MRVEINPGAIFHYGIGLEDIRAALASANANSPKGAIEDDDYHYQIYANDQATHAAQYRDLVIAYRNGAPVRLADVAEVVDFGRGPAQRRPRQRQAGVAVDPVAPARRQHHPGRRQRSSRAAAPDRLASRRRRSDVAVDRSKTIRQSLTDTEKTLAIAVLLVILVVFAFLRNVRAAAIPSVAVPISIIGSFGVMYLLGFSLNNLSLMALTISTGFVVDDAIVVLENISRHLEQGMPRVEAAIRGAGEVGFTVVSITLSLIAVFVPLLCSSAALSGACSPNSALTLSVAVLISMVVSLTTTPMMCALILPRGPQAEHGRLYRATERVFDADARVLSVDVCASRCVILERWRCRFRRRSGSTTTCSATRSTYGLFPVQDTGLIIGAIQGDQSISFQAMKTKLAQLQEIVAGGPGGRQRRRLHRRSADQLRLRLCRR